jgi:endonuclease/exonuclease/phosphatase family metal-dependent hydrolase
MVKKILAATTLCLSAALMPVAPTTAVDSATPLRVGSFNVRNATLPTAPGLASWGKRRGTAIRQILAKDLDVFGIQEASYAPHTGIKYAYGYTQYLDLVGGLNANGGSFRLTSNAAYNCKNARTPYKCERRNRGASGGDRIAYDSTRIEKVSRGATKYRAQGGSVRYFVWAVLRVRETGQEFLFTTTHLSSSSDTRLAQWREMVRMIEALKGDRPVVATGDFNTQKGNPIAAEMLPAMKNAGYGDVLNQEYDVNPVAEPRAETTVNGWVNSFNGGRSNVAKFGFASRRDKTGNIIDYVFASNHLTVHRWEVVVRYDPKTLDVLGRHASDHNLVVATLGLS